jgi:hypothetical protein
MLAVSALMITPRTNAMNRPFTYDELFRVFQHLTTVAEAESMARAATSSSDLLGPEHKGRGLEYRAAVSLSLTNDTLILLSLLSKDVARKVELYRAAQRAGANETTAEAREWEERRRVIKAWADAGYPTTD